MKLTTTSVLALLALALVGAGTASAKPSNEIDFRNARYCEILELRGAVPDAEVTVWNTIGLNECPAAKWESLDASSLAAERGAALVILNGPRYWLMDSATGSLGRMQSFHGLRMRKAATIPIRSASDLIQSPYTDRTIERTNVWRWESGRRVYELLAPDGSTYVMQSYSQIIDPALRIGDLSSIRERLDLPEGWRYRTRRLDRDLVVRAKGEATVVQDDLRNTYQLVRPSEESVAKRHRVDLAGEIRTIGSPQPGTLEDRGTISGRPFGDATIRLLATFAGSSVTGTFKVRGERGSAFGTVDMGFTIEGSQITLKGTADFTGGTGRYRGIEGTDLRAYDQNTLDGQNGMIELKGFATY